MLFIGNVLTGLTVGTGGRVGRVMSGRILDGGLPEKAFYGCANASVRDSSVWLTSVAARWRTRHRFPAVE